MKDYYASDVPLKDLREYYGLPNNYGDDRIVSLFPPMKLHAACPYCNAPFQADHISRGVVDATIDSYFENTVRCPLCDKSLIEIERELEEERIETVLTEKFSVMPDEFDWGTRPQNSREFIVLGSLIYEKSLLNHQYLAPIITKPYYADFTDCLRALRASSVLEPTYDFPDWRSGFELDENDRATFYWYKVPFSVNILNYEEEKSKDIKTINGRDTLELNEAELDVWLKTCVGYLVEYLKWNIDDLGYEPSAKKEEEFIDLLPALLRCYSPAQIACQIWSVMASLLKRDNECYEPWKRTGAYATAAVIKRMTRALSEGWDLNPNIPTKELPETFFEKYFFKIHVPIGGTWIYRRVPDSEPSTVVLPPAKMPKSIDEATPAMITFAKAIAEKLDLSEPDYCSYANTSEFITRYRNEFEDSNG